MCKVDINEQNKKFEETNRDFLAPFLNQKVTCVGTFIAAKFLDTNGKKGISLLFRNILINDTISCDHAWFIYLKNSFSNVIFGVNDIVKLECSVVEYFDKNGNRKIGFDEISSVENLTNNNELYENIDFKSYRNVLYSKNYLLQHNNYIEDYKPVEDLYIECGIDVHNSYTLNLSAVKLMRNKIAYWYGIEDNFYNKLVKNVLIDPYRYDHGFSVNDKYYVKINSIAFRQIMTNHFIISILLRNLEEERRNDFVNNLNSKIKEQKRSHKFLQKLLNSSDDYNIFKVA